MNQRGEVMPTGKPLCAVTGQQAPGGWINCPVCGALFVGLRWNQVYCSRKCSDAGYNRAHPVTRRPPDPALKQKAIPSESRVERAFAAWIASEDGRVVEAEVVRRAMLLRSRGIQRWGIASLWEAIRYDHTLALHGEAGAWRLNNSYRSLLARKVMAEVPQLRNFFTTRDLRGRT